MLGSATPTDVRRIVGEYFARLNIDIADDSLIETLVIRDGRYYGRSYRAGGVMAMWMIEIGLIQFYSEQGEMLATLTMLDDIATPRVGKAA